MRVVRWSSSNSCSSASGSSVWRCISSSCLICRWTSDWLRLARLRSASEMPWRSRACSTAASTAVRWTLSKAVARSATSRVASERPRCGAPLRRCPPPRPRAASSTTLGSRSSASSVGAPAEHRQLAGDAPGDPYRDEDGEDDREQAQHARDHGPHDDGHAGRLHPRQQDLTGSRRLSVELLQHRVDRAAPAQDVDRLAHDVARQRALHGDVARGGSQGLQRGAELVVEVGHRLGEQVGPARRRCPRARASGPWSTCPRRGGVARHDQRVLAAEQLAHLLGGDEPVRLLGELDVGARRERGVEVVDGVVDGGVLGDQGLRGELDLCRPGV